MRPPLTSLHNPTVKALVKLRQRRARDRQQCLLIDGARALHLALANGMQLAALYVDETVLDTHAALLHRAAAAGVTLQPVTTAVFHKIGYGEHPDGVLGLASQPCTCLNRLLRPPMPLYVIVEGLEKPGNLGAILRSADAAGVTGIILCDNQIDVWNPNVIRASQGACFTVPLAIASAAAALAWLHQAGIRILAATPTASQLYTQVDMRGPCAFVFGAEHHGLSAVWQHDTLLRIPMGGQVDSLNVAQAASILIFEAVRQRSLP
jgi:TrmH family RNA methyltransferase